jgi:hypothetical protein
MQRLRALRKVEGVPVADGSGAAGYSLHVKDGRPAYTYSYFRREVTTVSAPERLPTGESVVSLHFAYDGPARGASATVTLSVNGATVGEARLAHTVPNAFSFEETLDVGQDTASAVGPYAAPFRFTGTLERLEVRSEPPPGEDD